MIPRFLKEVSYEGETRYIYVAFYHDGKNALIMNDFKGEEFTQDSIILSVNLDGLDNGEVAIKVNYEEPYDMFDWLIDEGIVEYTGKHLESGYNVYPVGRLIVDL